MEAFLYKDTCIFVKNSDKSAVNKMKGFNGSIVKVNLYAKKNNKSRR